MDDMAQKITRRGVLSYLLLATVATSLPPKHVFAAVESTTTPDCHGLSFSSQPGTGPWIDETALLQHKKSRQGTCLKNAALHREAVLAANRVDKRDYENALAILHSLLARQGIRWKDSYRIAWTYQHYGVCDTSIHSHRLLAYARTAQDYLYSNVSGLMGHPPEWSLLARSPHSVPTTEHEYIGLVGKHTYLIYRLNAVDEAGEVIVPGIANIMPVERALNYIVGNRDHRPIQSTIFVIHGITSLASPFTELLHLTTHQPSFRLIEQLAEHGSAHEAAMMGRMYGESITEAAGILLAFQFLEKYGCRDETNRLNRLLQHTRHRYPVTGPLMAQMQKDGVQQVLGDYVDNPARLMRKMQ